ncbi:MAG: glutamate mutase L [Bacillota bacterium]
MKDSYLITDVGSTTSKTVLIGENDGEYRMLARGEHPTTVEAPYDDVTVGVLGSLEILSSHIGHPMASSGEPATRRDDSEIKYLSTSSAGGGLQMMVFGVMKNVTAESAKKAALGGGAIILDVMTTDDGRPSFMKLDSIRESRPDMILISGGLDGGNTAFALDIADLLNAAKPRPRFGGSFRIPVVYAGNRDAAPLVVDTLADCFDVKVVDNLRPAFDTEVLEPARSAIHELFMSHVMAHAPGYDRLTSWVDADIMPTPVAVGRIMKELADARRMNIVGMDIGGATTDVFSVFNGTLNRSVSANLGMSYSAGNVMLEAGIDNITRWLPFEMPPEEVADRICTKLINPTTIPGSLIDLQIEQALATEALRLAFLQHRQVATVPPKESPAWRSLLGDGRLVGSSPEARSIVDIGDVDMLVGSGGVLSHAPRRAQAALMMLNAFLPKGVTFLAVDSIFMMPHLGVLSQIQPQIALDVLEKDCFVPLGPVIALEGSVVKGRPVALARCKDAAGHWTEVTVQGGDIGVLPTPGSGEVLVEATSLGGASIDGRTQVTFRCRAGKVGVIIDARGRPLDLHQDPRRRAEDNERWAEQIGAYGPEGGVPDAR